jgi:hypothetical protein
MHICCRLSCLGISSKITMEICKIYEAGLYKPTLGKLRLVAIPVKVHVATINQDKMEGVNRYAT